jgi:uncharacterized protein DUF5939
VIHTAQLFIDVKGEPTRERQSLAVVFNRTHPPIATVTLQAGPLRLRLENRTDARVVPVAGQAMHDMARMSLPHRAGEPLTANLNPARRSNAAMRRFEVSLA